MRVKETTEGKYYRTELLVTLDDGRTVSVDLSSSDPQPSYVEEKLADGDPDYFCDDHYEREATRIVTDIIVKYLNSRREL